MSTARALALLLGSAGLGRPLGVATLCALCASGCVSTVIARVSAGDPGQLRLRNESDETVCYVLLGARRGRDALQPDEVVLPGEERDLSLASGDPTRVRILDCAERPLFEGEVVVDDAHGVVIALEVR